LPPIRVLIITPSRGKVDFAETGRAAEQYMDSFSPFATVTILPAKPVESGRRLRGCRASQGRS